MRFCCKWAIATAALASLLAGLALFPVSDPDLWIMLSTGREIAETGRVPDIDSWSHTAEGQPWVMHEWLSSLALYGVYRAAGFAGIVLLKLVLLALAFGLGLWAARPRLPWVMLAVGGLAVMGAQVGFSERVQIVTFLALVLQISLLEGLRRRELKPGPFLLSIAGLYLLWANTHLGMMSGLFVMFAYWVESLAAGIIRRDWGLFRALSLGLPVAFMMALVNPYGFELIKPFFKYYTDSQISGFDSLVYSTIHEYTPIFSVSVRGDPGVKWGLAWMGFSLLGIGLDWRHFRISSLLLWAGFFYLAYSAVKFIPVFVFATLVFTAENWARIASGLLVPEPLAKTRWPGRALFGALALAVLLAGVIPLYGRQAKAGPGALLGLDSGSYPSEGVDFLRENFTQFRLLNDFMDGGYLFWRGVPVFIDGRMSPFHDVLDDYVKIVKGDAKLLDRYGVDLALLRYPRSGKSASSKLHEYFSGSGQWALVYWDDICLLFAKRTERNRAQIEIHQYRYVNPIFTDPAAPPDSFQAELNRAIEREPRMAAAYLAAFNYYYRRDLDLAERYLRQGLAYGPDDASLHNNLGNIHLARGRLVEAVAEYRQAIKWDRNIAEAYCNLGFVHQMKGDFRSAELNYLKVLEQIDPLNVWAYNQIGMMLVENGRMARGVKYLQRGANIDPQSEAARNLKRIGLKFQ